MFNLPCKPRAINTTAKVRGKFLGVIRYRTTQFVLATILFANAGISFADFFNAYLVSPTTFNAQSYTNIVGITNPILLNSTSNSGTQPTTPAQPAPGGSKSTLAPAPPPGSRDKATATITKMVRAYPASVRPQAKKTFAQIYTKYRQVEKSNGIPKYDLAGAVAIFIGANYQGFRNVSVTNSDLKTLIGQVRGALQNSPEFAKVKPAKKREAYQQFAILGLFAFYVQEYFQQQPNPDLQLNFSDACRRSLEQFFNVNADNIEINSQGLVIFQ